MAEFTQSTLSVLQAVIVHTRERGCCPVLGQIRDRTGLHHNTVARCLLRLRADGYVRQDAKFAAYVPIRTAEGHKLTITITEVFDT